jgi:hypothetical protein
MRPTVDEVGRRSESPQRRTDPRGLSVICQFRVSAAKEGLQR